MKNGFTYQGFEAEALGGSIGGARGALQYGAQKDDVAVYLAADALDDKGWRAEFADRASPRLRRRRLAQRGHRVHVVFIGATSRFGAIAATPIQLLDQQLDRDLHVAADDKNDIALLNQPANIRLAIPGRSRAMSTIRTFAQWHIDGNGADIEQCDRRPFTLPDDAFGDTAAPLFESSTRQSRARGTRNSATVPGTIDRTRSSITAWRFAQAANNDKVFGHDNNFIVGGSLDHSISISARRARSPSSTRPLRRDRRSPAVIIHQPDLGQSGQSQTRRTPTSASMLTDTFDITPRLSLTAGGRLNVAQIKIRTCSATDRQQQPSITRASIRSSARPTR